MGDLTDFEKGMIVGARRAGLSISKTVELLGFSKAAVSKVYSRWSDTQDVSSRRSACGRRSLMDEHGRKWLAQTMEEIGQSTVQELTSQYNNGVPRPVSVRTMRRTLCRLGYRGHQDLKEKKEVVEEKEKTENGSGDAPANGTEENGAKHKEENAEDPEEEEDEGEGEGEGEEEEEGEGEETESDGHPVKRPAEEEEKSETKKQKTENGDSTEVKESA